VAYSQVLVHLWVNLQVQQELQVAHNSKQDYKIFLGLPQAAFDQLISLGRGIGLPLKDGGMASYAKGGNVKPVPANFQNYLKNKAKRNS
jgi:hypothetical protein